MAMTPAPVIRPALDGLEVGLLERRASDPNAVDPLAARTSRRPGRDVVAAGPGSGAAGAGLDLDAARLGQLVGLPCATTRRG